MINVSQPIVEQDEFDAIAEVLASGMITQGPKVKEFEERFAVYCGVDYAVAVNNGTAAIHTALYAMGVSEGDEVITSPFTFVASANPILMLGAKVVFADISEGDFNLDPVCVRDKISDKTSCILPVDLYGQVYNIAGIRDVIGERNIKIMEDACQSIGAEQNGIKAGACGDIAAFSFYATKNIMCGEGGMITTNNAEFAEKCKMFRHHGQSEKTRYEYWDLGYNYRMTDLSASLALVQMNRLDQLSDRRIANADKLTEGLMGVPGLLLPKVNSNNKHVFHQYTIRITDEFCTSRDEFREYLKSKNIGTGVYYPKPLHLHPHFKKMGYSVGDFPIAEKMSEEVLSLPVHPSLNDQELDIIINCIKEYVR